jgi:uncharacterized protein YdeI (YjbR/CyaY-like superfamily)
MNPNVDAFIEGSEKWQKEFAKLRAVILAHDLSEEVKWGVPCYAHNKKNVVLIHGFKEYCAILFVKGALLKDPEGVLVQQTENVQSARQMRFTNAQQIAKMEPVLNSYIDEAIAIDKSGLTVAKKKTAEFAVPEEFEEKLAEDPGLKNAFEALTPGRQRAYLLYFVSAKQAKTREARIDKCAPNILAGKGLDD